MSQADIVILLRENRGIWFTPKQISNLLSINKSCVSNNLQGLMKTNLIIKKVGDKKGKQTGSIGYKYRYNDAQEQIQ